jgi:hypothetical protein
MNYGKKARGQSEKGLYEMRADKYSMAEREREIRRISHEEILSCIVGHYSEEFLLADFTILVQVEFVNHGFPVVNS